jgi:FdhD protein
LELSETIGFVRYEEGRSRPAEGQVVREGLVRLHVNGVELARMMCTPEELDWLALGFLRSEGIIRGMADVRLVKVCPSRTCVDVWLRDADFEPPGRPVITSGCGGGITFADLTAGAEPLVSDLRVSLRQLGRLMGELLSGQQTRGIHTGALADGERLIAVAEDVGRHNTLDKLWGHCLVENVATQDRILLSTGRISSEMLNKAARMRVPVIVSRTSPTTMSVALANAWDITLVGYARRTSFNVYAGRGRIVEDGEGMTDAYS